MIKIVIIGAGNVAKNFHLPAWKKIKGVKIVSIVDKKLNKARLLAKKYKINSFYKNIDSLFKKQSFDAVDICTPNQEHKKNIIFSLKKNKHVICEKPFVLDLKSFNKISHLAKKNKLICVTAQHQRFRKPSIDFKKLVNKKKIGSIYTAHICATIKRSKTVKNPYFTTLSKAGGGPSIDLGSHFVDLAWWIMGNPKPISVSTYTSNELAKYLKKTENTSWKKFDIEDYASGIIRFERNKSITFQMSYLLNCENDEKKITFYGTKGGFLWPNSKLITIKDNLTKKKSLFSKEKNPASVLEMQHFIDSIKKKTKQSPTLKEMEYMVKIIEAFRKSVREKREVKV
jgi:predicted dehydrogenase